MYFLFAFLLLPWWRITPPSSRLGSSPMPAGPCGRFAFPIPYTFSLAFLLPFGRFILPSLYYVVYLAVYPHHDGLVYGFLDFVPNSVILFLYVWVRALFCPNFGFPYICKRHVFVMAPTTLRVYVSNSFVVWVLEQFCAVSVACI